VEPSVPAGTYFAARPANYENPPTTAKNAAAIQASDAARVFVMLIAKTVIAAISQSEAIASAHQ